MTTNSALLTAAMRAGLLVGIFTRAADFLLRENYRIQCNTSAYHHKFFVGLPVTEENPHRKQQGRLISRDQHRVLDNIKTEQRAHNDVILLPYRDTYQDLPLKTIALIRYAHRHRVHTLVKIDEEFCLRPHRVPKSDPSYFGSYLFSGTEYKSQRGYDNMSAPYFSGYTYGLSHSVLKWLVTQLWDTSLLYELYGSSSEDVDVGRWVQMLHKDIEYKTVGGLTRARTQEK